MHLVASCAVSLVSFVHAGGGVFEANLSLPAKYDGASAPTAANLTAVSYWYKFVLLNWAAQERFGVDDACTMQHGGIGGPDILGNYNRFLGYEALAHGGFADVATVCWNGCGACTRPPSAPPPPPP
eukprot:5067021-Prymnesium_polylepis.1